MVDAETRSPVELHAAAVALARRLTDQAVWRDGGVTWPTLVPDPQSMAPAGWAWVEEDATPFLYDGLAGIARGLAYAVPLVRDQDRALAEQMRTTAETALRDAVAACRDMPADAPAGLYDGRLGTACVAVELGRMWRDATLERGGLDLARAVLLASAADLDAGRPDEHHPVNEPAAGRSVARRDLISGLAGLVCGAAWTGGWTRDPAIMRAAVALGRHLEHVDGLKPGLAHGLAGVAVALAHAARLDGHPDWLAWLSEAEARENAWFAPDVGSWPDLRPPEDEPGAASPEADAVSFPPWWCHGAAGIGLARQRVADLTGLPSGDAEVARSYVRRAAIDTLQSSADAPSARPWTDWSLCHGVTGAVALLLSSPHRRDADADRAMACRLLALGAAEARAADGRWQGGVRSSDEQSGLMTGHAGILLVLTRAIAGETRAFWPLWL